MQWHKTAKQNILNKKPDLKDLLFTFNTKTRKENSKNEAKKKSFSKKSLPKSKIIK